MSNPDWVIKKSYSGIKEEQNEKLMIKLANTVTHPRAVMVHPENAPFANGAVMDAFLLYYVALEAVQGHSKRIDFLSGNNKKCTDCSMKLFCFCVVVFSCRFQSWTFP